jgi:hypothetical protein
MEQNTINIATILKDTNLVIKHGNGNALILMKKYKKLKKENPELKDALQDSIEILMEIIKLRAKVNKKDYYSSAKKNLKLSCLILSFLFINLSLISAATSWWDGDGIFTGNLNVTGNITAPGDNLQVFFNDNGVISAIENFTYNKATGMLTIPDLNVTSGQSIRLNFLTIENEGHFSTFNTNLGVFDQDVEHAFIIVYEVNGTQDGESSVVLQNYQNNSMYVVKFNDNHSNELGGINALIGEQDDLYLLTEENQSFKICHFANLTKDELGNIDDIVATDCILELNETHMALPETHIIDLAGAIIESYNVTVFGRTFSGIIIREDLSVREDDIATFFSVRSTNDSANASTYLTALNDVSSNVRMIKFSSNYEYPNMGAITGEDGILKILGSNNDNRTLSGILFGTFFDTITGSQDQILGFENETISMAIYKDIINMFVDLNTSGNLTLGGDLDMQNHSINNIYSLNSPDGSAIALGNNPIFSSFSGLDQSIVMATNQSLPAGAITHTLLDIFSNKVLAAWQSGKNDSGQYTRNSMGIFPDAGGSTNLSLLTNVEDMWEYYGIESRADYHSSDNKTALGVLYAVETQKLFLHDELGQGQLRVEGEADFILTDEDDDVGIFNGGQLWLRKDRVEEVGVPAGESFKTLNQDFEDGSLSPFINIGTLNWQVLPLGGCHDGECAFSSSGDINNMQANISTFSANYCNLSFYITTINYDAGDLINVTIDDEQVYSIINGTNPNDSLITVDLPVASINQSNVAVNFIADSDHPINEIAYIDDVVVTCNSSGEGNVNVTRFDGTIYFGESKEYYIRYNDSTKVFNFVPNNVSFTSVTEQDVNITASVTLNGTTITDWGQAGYWNKSGNNLYLKNTDDRVGIGTTTPSHELNVIGSANVTGNLTLGQKIVFALGGFIQNIISGQIDVNGTLNVTENLSVGGDLNVDRTIYADSVYGYIKNGETGFAERHIGTGVFSSDTISLSPNGTVVSTQWGMDGMRLFVTTQDEYIYQYDLTIPYDISTATLTANNSFTATTNTGFYTLWNDDGTVFWHGGRLARKITLTNPWDISSIASDTNVNIAFRNPFYLYDLQWRSDGMRVYGLGYNLDDPSGDDMSFIEWGVTTPYDFDTKYNFNDDDYPRNATIHNFPDGMIDAWIYRGFDISPDGKRVYASTNTGVEYELVLGTAWNLSTAVVVNNLTRTEYVELLNYDISPDASSITSVNSSGTIVQKKLGLIVDGYVGIGTDSPTHELNVVGSANFTENITFGDKLITGDVELDETQYTMGTGIKYGGVISRNASNSSWLDVTAGEGRYVNYSDINNPIVETFTWEDQSFYPNVNGFRSKKIAFQKNASGGFELVAQTEITQDEIREKAIIGRCISTDGLDTCNIPLKLTTPAFGLQKTVEDLMQALGSQNINDEIYPSANGSNMLLDVSEGDTFRAYANFAANPTSPNTVQNNASYGITSYAYHLQNSTQTISESQIDPNYYDLDGVLTAVPVQKWTLQEIWRFPVSRTNHIIYGQAYYDSKGNCLSAIALETKQRNLDILDGAMKIGYLCVREGATALNDEDDAVIIQAGLDGGGFLSHWEREENGVGLLRPAEANDRLELANNFSVNGTFIVDAGNERVGIGTSIPGHKLEVNGSTFIQDNFIVNNSNLFVNASTGYMGIGTNTPEAIFHIYENTSNFESGGYIIEQAGQDDMLFQFKLTDRIQYNMGIAFNETGFPFKITGEAGAIEYLSLHNETFYVGNGLDFNVDNGSLFVNGSTNYVGIGTTSPSAELDVVGTSEFNGDVTVNDSNINIYTGSATSIQGIYFRNSTTSLKGGIFYTEDGSIGDMTMLTEVPMSMLINGDFDINGNEFFIESDNGNIGIGTASPSYKLEIAGNANLNNTLYVNESGNVGIGTSSPSEELVVSVTGNSTPSIIRVESVLSSNADVIQGIHLFKDYVSDYGWKIEYDTDATLDFISSQAGVNVTRLTIERDTGYVGIGTETPSHTLNVVGKTNITDDLIVDDTDFFVDVSNGRIGMGTSGPAYDLDIYNSAGASLRLNATAGQATHSAGLAYYIEYTDNAGAAIIEINSKAGDGTSDSVYRFGPNSGSTGRQDILLYEPSSIDIQAKIGTSGESTYFNAFGGNFGIGTITPSHQLEVDGDVNLNDTLYVDGIGNVGIGTQSPDADLHVVDTGAAASVIVERTGGYFTHLLSGAAFSLLGFNDSSYFQIGPVSSKGGVTSTDTSLTIDSSGNLGIGISPTEKLDLLDGNFLQRGGTSSNAYSPETISTFNVGNDPEEVKVVGSYAYILESASSLFRVVNVHDPSNPSLVSTVSTTTSSPEDFDIANNFAYAVDPTDGELIIIDLLDPSSVHIDNITSVGTEPKEIEVRGGYAYIIDSTDDQLIIMDVADTGGPFKTDNISLGCSPYSFDVVGSYAYIGCWGGVADIEIYDISDPYNPIQMLSVLLGIDILALEVSNNYIYAAENDQSPRIMYIFDATDVTSLVTVSNVSVGASGRVPQDIEVVDGYAYMSTSTDPELLVFDVRDPSNPGLIGSSGLVGTGTSVDVEGRYAFISEAGTHDDLQIYDISGIEVQSAHVHSLRAGSATFINDVVAIEDVAIKGGLDVGYGGINSEGIINLKNTLKIIGFGQEPNLYMIDETFKNEFRLHVGNAGANFFLDEDDIVDNSRYQFRVDGSEVAELDANGDLYLDGTVIPDNDCHLPGAEFVSEESGALSPGYVFSFGNGGTSAKVGALQRCSGLITGMGVICDTCTGTTTTIEMYVNNESTNCIMDIDQTHPVGGKYGMITTCSESFNATDILQAYVLDDDGVCNLCVASFGTLYD